MFAILYFSALYTCSLKLLNKLATYVLKTSSGSFFFSTVELLTTLSAFDGFSDYSPSLFLLYIHFWILVAWVPLELWPFLPLTNEFLHEVMQSFFLQIDDLHSISLKLSTFFIMVLNELTGYCFFFWNKEHHLHLWFYWINWTFLFFQIASCPINSK